jgi:hypothetical protein
VLVCFGLVGANAQAKNLDPAAALPAADVVLYSPSWAQATEHLAPLMNRIALALPHVGMRHLGGRMRARLGFDPISPRPEKSEGAKKAALAFLLPTHGHPIWAIQDSSPEIPSDDLFAAFARSRWGARMTRNGRVRVFSPPQGRGPPALVGRARGWVFVAPDGCGDKNGACLLSLLRIKRLGQSARRWSPKLLAEAAVFGSISAAQVEQALAPVIGPEASSKMGEVVFSLNLQGGVLNIQGTIRANPETLGMAAQPLFLYLPAVGGLALGVSPAHEGRFVALFGNGPLATLLPISPRHLRGGLSRLILRAMAAKTQRPWPLRFAIGAEFQNLGAALKLARAQEGTTREGASVLIGSRQHLRQDPDIPPRDAFLRARLDPAALRGMLLLLPLTDPNAAPLQRAASAGATTAGALTRRLGEALLWVGPAETKDQMAFALSLPLKGEVRTP